GRDDPGEDEARADREVELADDQEQRQRDGDGAVGRARLEVVQQVDAREEVAGAERQDEEEREEDDDDRVLARGLEAAAERGARAERGGQPVHAAAPLPKAARMTLSSFAASPARSATIRPARTTRTRCARPSTSSSSLETRRTPSPFAASSLISS